MPGHEELTLASQSSVPPSVLSSKGTMTRNVVKVCADGSHKTRQCSRADLLGFLRAESRAPIHAADLREVDPPLVTTEPALIKVRPNMILISLSQLGVGAIILPDEIHLLAMSSPDPILKAIQSALHRWWNQREPDAELKTRAASSVSFSSPTATAWTPSASFEITALEAVLFGACSHLHIRTASLVEQEQEDLAARRASNSAVLLAEEMASAVDQLSELSASLDAALARSLAAVEVRPADPPQHSPVQPSMPPPSPGNDQRRDPREPLEVRARQLELLFEGYLDHVRHARRILKDMKRRVDEDVSCANLILDRTRNRLIKFDVVASTVAAATGLGSCAAGIFGMNLPAAVLGNEASTTTPYNNWLFALVAIAIACLVFTIVTCMICVLYARTFCSHLFPKRMQQRQQSRPAGTVAAVRAERERDRGVWANPGSLLNDLRQAVVVSMRSRSQSTYQPSMRVREGSVRFDADEHQGMEVANKPRVSIA